MAILEIKFNKWEDNYVLVIKKSHNPFAYLTLDLFKWAN